MEKQGLISILSCYYVVHLVEGKECRLKKTLGTRKMRAVLNKMLMRATSAASAHLSGSWLIGKLVLLFRLVLRLLHWNLSLRIVRLLLSARPYQDVCWSGVSLRLSGMPKLLLLLVISTLLRKLPLLLRC